MEGLSTLLLMMQVLTTVQQMGAVGTTMMAVVQHDASLLRRDTLPPAGTHKLTRSTLGAQLFCSHVNKRLR